MATRKITVTPEQLTGAAEKIEQSAGDYQRTYTKLYSEVESMRAAWDGTDNVAYTTQVKGFQDDFTLMYKLMTEYAQFLRMSAKQYETTQNEIIQAAQTLVN
jgi:WXG100 family type VII secretion target